MCVYASAVAFDFVATEGTQQLSLTKGDSVTVTRRTPQWMFGSISSSRFSARGSAGPRPPSTQQRGIFPASFVVIDEAFPAPATAVAAARPDGENGGSPPTRPVSLSWRRSVGNGWANETPSPGGFGSPATATPVAASQPTAAAAAASPAAAGAAAATAAGTTARVGVDANGAAPPQPQPAALDGRGSALDVKIDRCVKEWNVSMRRYLEMGNAAAYHEVKTQIAQLLEWRRQMVSAEQSRQAKQAGALRESVMRLVESATQIREGLLVPRTDKDEVASEANSGVYGLFDLHTAAQARLEAGVRIPLTLTQQLEMETTKGLQAAAPPSSHAATQLPISGGARSTDSSSADDERLHLLLEVECIKGPGMDDPVDLYFSMWDEARQCMSSEDFHVFVEDPRSGLTSVVKHSKKATAFGGDSASTAAVVAAATAAGGAGGGGPFAGVGAGAGAGPGAAAAAAAAEDFRGSIVAVQQLRVLFRDVPRRMVGAGGCFLVCTAFRRGTLQVSAPTSRLLFERRLVTVDCRCRYRRRCWRHRAYPFVVHTDKLWSFRCSA